MRQVQPRRGQILLVLCPGHIRQFSWNILGGSVLAGPDDKDKNRDWETRGKLRDCPCDIEARRRIRAGLTSRQYRQRVGLVALAAILTVRIRMMLGFDGLVICNAAPGSCMHGIVSDVAGLRPLIALSSVQLRSQRRNGTPTMRMWMSLGGRRSAKELKRKDARPCVPSVRAGSFRAWHPFEEPKSIDKRRPWRD